MKQTISSIEELEALYGTPGAASLEKVADRVTPEYQAYFDRARFAALTTVGPEGTDCSPRGDIGPVVRVRDERTLLMPDWHGNNRIDSLRNIVRDGRVSLMLMIPGSKTIIRVNGSAVLSNSDEMLKSFDQDGKHPRSVICITIAEIYFQCARALIRSELWQFANWESVDDLPTPGRILAARTKGGINGEDYDKAWPSRAKSSMW